MGQQEGFNEVLIQPLQQFAKDSIHLVKKCTKPDRKEFVQIARATGVGFLIMGFIGESCWLFVRVFVMLTETERLIFYALRSSGFFVKLIHIPINNILVGN